MLDLFSKKPLIIIPLIVILILGLAVGLNALAGQEIKRMDQHRRQERVIELKKEREDLLEDIKSFKEERHLQFNFKLRVIEIGYQLNEISEAQLKEQMDALAAEYADILEGSTASSKSLEELEEGKSQKNLTTHSMEDHKKYGE